MSGSAAVSYSDSAFCYVAYLRYVWDSSQRFRRFTLNHLIRLFFEVEFLREPLSASIDLDPQDQTVFVGDDAQFNVQASGSAPLFYQWYYNTNSVLASQTNSTLTVTNAQTSDAGGYSALVSNAFGSVTSAVAQLTVTLPVAPSISTEPAGSTASILPGANATFTVVMGSSDPLIYPIVRFNNATQRSPTRAEFHFDHYQRRTW